MMKHTQTIFKKAIIDWIFLFNMSAFSLLIHDFCIEMILQYWRRGYSSPLSSRVKQGLAEQDGLALFGAFIGGWCIHTFMNIYKKREHWYRVDRLSKENDRRFHEVFNKCAQQTMEITAEVEAALADRKSRGDSV
ncbi:unnamed protein product [Eruca vesicaria subsp. sativa]|uniref:Uncharacterized protein n=1 Tax=Eruca vesicaria subsp. sativa TaxID=29727 RepID=A0ABC8JKG7_ERUVS|nr:unnamed protein product [Eruca vesicaria subsp. sativa]